MDKKKELQDQYAELYGKGAFKGWDEEKLQEMISAKEETAPKKAKKEQFNIDPNKTYVFKLTGEFAPVTFLPTEMNAYDVESKRSRKIRCVSTEDSPYVDEQDENSKTDALPLVFNKGYVYIDGTSTNRIKYMMASDFMKGKSKTLPENAHIVGRVDVEDKDLIIADKRKKEDKVYEAMGLIRTAKLQDVKDYLRSVYLIDVDKADEDEVMIEASAKIKEDAEEWTTNFNSPKHKIKSNIQRLFNTGELEESGGEVKWKKSSGVILTYDEKKGERADDVLAKFAMLDTKEAKDFKKSVEDKLS